MKSHNIGLLFVAVCLFLGSYVEPCNIEGLNTRTFQEKQGLFQAQNFPAFKCWLLGGRGASLCDEEMNEFLNLLADFIGLKIVEEVRTACWLAEMGTGVAHFVRGY